MTIIGYPRACQELAASRALIQQGMAQVRGPAAVPPMDPRVPKLVAAREFVRRMRQTQEEGK